MDPLIQLIILFFVIIDPPASFTVFLATSSSFSRKKRFKTAGYALSIAGGISLLVLIFGSSLLDLFSTNIDELRIAGGIILGILGVKMSLGIPLRNLEQKKEQSEMAIASIIGTPLITGPACIIAIIVSSHDYGRLVTGLALLIVLLITGALFLLSLVISKFLGKGIIRIISTLLGLITISWGVKLITEGIKAIFFG